jgi:FkbM family methyltransferase
LTPHSGPDGGLVFDIGAHRGEDTAYYLKRGFRVVAVEGEPRHAAHIRDRFADEIGSGRLKLVDKAIAEHSGHAIFHRNLDISVWGTIRPSWAERNVRYGSRIEEITVACLTPSELFATFGVPHYLKIDVEGADRLVLESLRPLAARPPYVSIESETVSFAALMQEFELFSELGYRDFKLSPQHLVQEMRIPSSSPHGAAVDWRFEEHASGPFGEDVAGPWLSAREAIAEYKSVFVLYDLYEAVQGGIFQGSIARFRDRYGHDAGGWYDTHARLGPASG